MVAGAVLLVAAGGAALLWRREAVPVVAALPIPAAGEAAILADRPAALSLFRVAADPEVVVLDFPTLEQQGAMLNRVAALVEKAGLPRDRVLDDAGLAAAIRASGASPATYYYGHDYRAADIARFFALADRDHVVLDEAERLLRRLAAQEGWLRAGSAGALISIVAAGGALVSEGMRGAILHHELSHGVYFTRPAYAAWTQRFWEDSLTPDERAAFRGWLGSEGYDAGEEDLIVNETQAYLVFTPDPTFFTPAMVGMSPERAAALRAAFLAGVPAGVREALP